MRGTDFSSAQPWFYGKLRREHGDEAVIEAYRNGGLEGVRHAVLEEKSRDIAASATEDSDDATTAFTRETVDWPHEACAYLARYETVNENGPEVYQEKTRQFAERLALLGEDESRLVLPPEYRYNDDPFTDDRLTEQQAEVLVVCRNYLIDDPEQDVLSSDIFDKRSFARWLKRTDGDVSVALRAQGLDEPVPVDVARQIRPTSKWEEHDPGDVATAMCDVCGVDHYYVETNAGVRWVDDGGNTSEIDDLHDASRGWYALTNSIADQLCESCKDGRFGSSLSGWLDVCIVGERAVCHVKVADGVATPNDGVAGTAPLSALHDETVEFAEHAIMNWVGGNDTAAHPVRPNGAYGSTEAEEQNRLIRDVAGGDVAPPTVVPSVFITRGNSATAYTLNDASLCTDLKIFLEETDVETEEESEDTSSSGIGGSLSNTTHTYPDAGEVVGTAMDDLTDTSLTANFDSDGINFVVTSNDDNDV